MTNEATDLFEQYIIYGHSVIKDYLIKNKEKEQTKKAKHRIKYKLN